MYNCELSAYPTGSSELGGFNRDYRIREKYSPSFPVQP